MLKIQSDLRKFSDLEKSKILARFFKTGAGQYAEGDKFIGVTVPQTRTIARKYSGLSFKDISSLMTSGVHEERLCALLILVDQFEKGDRKTKDKIFKFYLKNTRYINNWDLVDLSADKIIGAHLENKPKDILLKLAESKSLWERRISIVATFHFIKKGEPKYTLQIAKILINDNHDLIHKAAGWMLREVGKRCNEKILTDFLNQYAHLMPRTTLRYAIERFPEQKRQKYLKIQTT